jgi:autotransporter-associated beta strand protein
MILATIFAGVPVQAATYYWDADATVAGNSINGTGLGGSGIWDTSSPLWWNLSNDVAWPNSLLDSAVFTGTAGSITLGAPINAGSLFFKSDRYALNGGTLTLGGPALINVGVYTSSTIDSEIAGTAGLTKTGDGTLVLTNNSNSFSGDLVINGGSLVVSNPGQLGTGTSVISINGQSNTGNPGYSGGSLVLQGGIGGMTVARDISVSGRGPGAANSTGGLISIGNNTITGDVTLTTTATESRAISVFGNTTIAGNVLIGGAGQLTYLYGNGNWIVSGQVTGYDAAVQDRLIKAGQVVPSTLWLQNNANNFAQPLRLDSGSVRVTTPGALGASSSNLGVDFNNGTLEVRTEITDWTSHNTYVRGVSGNIFVDHDLGSRSLNKTIAFGALNINANANINMLGRNGYNLSVGNGSTMVWPTGGSLSFSNTGSSGTLFVNTSISHTDTAVRNLTYTASGEIVQNGDLFQTGTFAVSLVKGNTGMLTLNGLNPSTMTGTTTINAGTITVSRMNQLPTDALLIGNATTTSGAFNYIGLGETSSKNITLNTTTANVYINANGTGPNGLILNGTISAVAGNKTLVLGGASTADNEIQSSIPGPVGSNIALQKIGIGTWVLSGANLFNAGSATAGITVSGGTLKIKDTFAGSSRDVVVDTNALIFGTDSFSQMAGGALQYVGASGAASTETLGQLIATTGHGTVQALPTGGGTAALTFTSLGTRGVGATVNVLNGGAVNISGTSGFVNSGYFFNGADFAYSTGGLIGAPTYDTSAGFVTAGAALTGASHNLVTAAGTTTGVLGISSLKIVDGGLVNQTGLLTINTGANTPGGILVDGGSSVISGTGVTTGGSGDLVVNVNQALDSLTMAAPITSTTTGGLTKTGLGTLILQGAQAYTGATTINQGTIQLDMNSRLGGSTPSNNNNLTIRQGAVLDLNSNLIGVGAFNGAGSVTNTGSSRAFLTIGNNNQNGYFTGLISGDLTLVKVGTGTSMSITGLNTFTGATGLSGGTLIVNNLANIGSPSAIGAGDATDDATNAASLQFNGGTLLYQGANGVIYQNTQTPSVSTDRLFTLVGNGTIDSTGTFGAPTLSTVGNNAALVFSNPGDIRFTGAGARTLTLQGGSTGDNYFAPRLGNNPVDPSPSTTGLLSLTKSGTGLWILGNEGNDYSGTTSINGGALQAIDGKSLPTGSNLFLNGGVFQSSGTGADRFDRTLGTGSDQFRFAPISNGGFSAGTAKFVVDWSGLGTPTWGSTTNFLGAGALILNNATSLSDLEIVGNFNVAAGVAATPTISTSSNTTITITTGSTAGLTIGQAITGTNIPAGSFITSITGATTFTINQNATATGTGIAATISAGGWRQIQVDDNSTTNLDFATVSGVIGGDGGLSKIGSAPLILGNANTYSGHTVIRQEAVFAQSIGAAGATSSSFGTNAGGGYLELGNPGTTTTVSLMYVGSGETATRPIYLGGTTGTRRIDSSGSGALILTNLLNSTAASVNTTGGAKTLELRGSNSDVNMVTSILTDNAGALTVTKTDGGVWALAPVGGPNTFTGNLNISAGTLGLTADAIGSAANVIITNAAMFAYGGTLNTTKPITLANNSTAVFTGSNDIILATLQKQAGANDQTISNNLDAGKVLSIGNFLNLEGATATRNMNFRGTGSTIVTGAIRNNSATSLTRIDIRIADGASFTLSGNNAADSLGFTGGLVLGQGTLIVANTGALGPAANNVILAGGTFTSTVDLSGANRILNRIQLQGDQVTINGNQNIEFGAAIAMDQNGSRFLLNNLDVGKSLLISGQVNLTNDGTARTLTMRGSGVTTITGVVSNGSTGVGTLAYSGLDTLTLTATNTATGSLTVNRNTVVLSGANGSWNAGTVTLNPFGTLRLDNTVAGSPLSNANNNNNRLNASGAFTGNGGTLDIIGAPGGTTVTTGNLALNGVQTYITASGGPVTVNFASMTMPNSGSSLNLLGIASLGTTNKVFIGGTVPNQFNNIMPRVFIGDDFSTYVGGTTGVAAFAAYNNTNDLNAAVATDTLNLTANSGITINKSVNAMKLGSGGVAVGGNTGTTLTLAGAAILSIGNNTLNVPMLSMGGNTGYIQVKNGTTLNVNSSVLGTAGIAKALTGDINLNTQNFYTGTTNLLNGTMKLAGGLNTIFQNNIFNINTGATLDLNGNTQYFERLSDPGILPGSGGMITSNAGFGTLVTNMNAAGTTVMTQINGNLNFARIGGQTLTLGSAHSYVGSTTLMGGTLTLQDDATILNTSSIDLNAATLILNNNGSLQTANYNRIGDSIPITLRDGTLQFTGKVADVSTETFGALMLAQGANTITVATGGNGSGAISSADITFASLTRAADTTVNFTGTSLGYIGNNVRLNFAAAPTTYLGGVLGAWAIVNNTDYAAYNSANGVGAVGNGGYVGYVSTFGSGNITNLGNISGGVFSTNISAATTAMLRLNGVYANNITFTDNTSVLNLELGGILRQSNSFSSLFGTTAVRGVITAGGNETTGTRELVIYASTSGNPTFGGGTTNPTTSTITMSSTQGLLPGMTITGTGILPGTTIASIDSFTQVTLSQATTNSTQQTSQTYTAGSFVNGSTTSGSNLISMNSTVGIYPGMTITGTGIPVGSYITSVENGTQVRISQNASSDNPSGVSFTIGVGNIIVNSVITDNTFGNAVRFVKSGAGSVNLSANNTYTGGTVVDQGTLNLIGSGVVLPAGGVILNSSTLAMLTNAGQIDPSNTVTLRRSSTLTLVGNNTLAGLMFENTGGTTNPLVTVGAGNTLTLTAAAAVTVLNSNALTVPTISLGTLALTSGTKTFDIQGPTVAGQLYSIISPALNVTSVITGAGSSINKIGSGILQLSAQNTFDGGVNLQSGGILFSVSSTSVSLNQGLTSGPLGTGGLTAAAGTTLLVDGSRTISNDITFAGNPIFDSTANSAWTLTLNGNITLPSGAIQIGVNNPALTVNMLGNIPNMSSITNITKTGLGILNFNSTGYTGDFNAGQLGNPTSLSIFNDGDGTGNPQTIALGNVTFDAGIVPTITVGRAGQTFPYTLAANKILAPASVNSIAGGLTLVNNHGYGLAVPNDVTLVGSPTFSVATATNSNVTQGLYLNGVISGTGFTKIGAGTLVLGNSGNNFTGNIVINQGVVSIGSASGFGNAANIVVLSPTTGTSTLRVTGDVITSNPIQFAGTANIRAIEVTFGSTLQLNSAFNLNSGAGATAALVKNDNGVLAINANNSGWSGALNINAGAVRALTSNALGTGRVTVATASGSALQLAGGVNIANPFTISGTTSNGINTGGVIESVSGVNTYSGAIIQTSGAAITYGARAGATLNLTGTNSSPGANSVTFAGAGNINVSSVLGNGSTFNKIGSGTLTFTGASTLAASTALNFNAGTTVFQGSGAIGANGTGNVLIDVGATLTIDNSAAGNVNNRFGSTRPFVIRGGNFNLIGSNTGATTETFASPSLNRGYSVITVEDNGFATNLLFTGSSNNVAIAQNAGGPSGATVLFRVVGANATIRNTGATNGFIFNGQNGATGTATKGIMPYALFDNTINGNGFSFATGDSGGTTNAGTIQNVRALAANEYGVTNAVAASTNALINANVALSANVTPNSLTFDPTTNANIDFTLNSGVLFNLSSGGILVRTGTTVNFNGAGVFSQTSGFSPLTIWTLGDLNLSTVLHGGQGISNGNSSLMKAGAGTLTISTPTSSIDGLVGMSVNSLSGQMMINQGTVVLNGGKNTIQANNYLALSGGSLDLNGTSQQILSLFTDSGVANAGGTVFSSTGMGNLVINQDNAQRLFSGTITGNVKLTRSGQNNFLLYSAQTYVGSTVIQGGNTFLRDEGALVNTPSIELSYATLTIDNSGGTMDLTNRVNDAAPITLRGGTIQFNGRAQTASTESLGVVTLAQANSLINVAAGGTGINSAVLSLAGLNRTVGGGTVNFGAGSGAGTIGNTARVTIQAINGASTATVGGGLLNGIIGGWAITNTDNFASYSPVLGMGALGQTGFAQYSPLILSAAAGPTDNIRVNYTAASTIAENTTINSVKFDNVVLGGVTIAAGKTLTLGSGGFLNFTSTPWNFGTVLNQGTLTSGGPELFIYAQGGGTPTFNAVIAGNNMSLVRSGANTIVLAATNTYSGGTFINQGTTNVAVTGNIPLANDVTKGLVVGGGTINFNAPGAIAADNFITVNGNGVVNLYGDNSISGVVMNNNGGTGNPSLFTYVNASSLGALLSGATGVLTIGSGGVTATSSNVGTTNNIFGRVDFGTSANTISVGTIDVNGVTDVAPLQSGLALQGVVGSSGGITKNGAGVLGLNGQMIFTGNLNVASGGVRLGATNGGSRFSTMNLAAGTTLNLAGLNSTIGGLSGSGTVFNHGGAVTLSVGFNNDTTTFSGKFSRFNDGIVNPVFIQKVGTGTLNLTGAQNLADASSGTMTIAGGTVSFREGGRWFVSQVAPAVALNQTFSVLPGGTLLLDNSAGSEVSRLGLGGTSGDGTAPVAGTLAMNGGTLRIVGSPTAPTLEWIANGNFAGGGGRIELDSRGQALRLAFSAIANRGTLGSMVITGINGSAIGSTDWAVLTSATTPNQMHGTGIALIRPDIIVDADIDGEGTGFMVLDPTNLTYRAVATSETISTVTSWASGTNGSLYTSQLLNAVSTSTNSITTGGNENVAGPTFTTLDRTQFVGGTSNEAAFGAYYRTGAFQSLVISSGGVLIRPDTDVDGNNVATTVNFNAGTVVSSQIPYFHVLSDATLNINSFFYGGGSGADYHGFVKAGAGVVNFNGRYFTRYYTGNSFTVNGGTVNLNSGYDNTLPILPGYTNTSGVASINGTPLSVNNASSILDLHGRDQFVGSLSSINPLPGYGGTIRTTGGPATLISNGGGTFAGTLADGVDGPSSVLSFIRAGNNTTLLTSTNTYTGATTIRGGTLQLRDFGSIAGSTSIGIHYGTLSVDNSGLNPLNNLNPTRVSATAPVTMQGGTLLMTAGGSINSSVNFGSVSLTGGANTITPTINSNQGSVNTVTLANLNTTALVNNGGTLHIAAAVGLLGINQAQVYLSQFNGGTTPTGTFLGPNIIVNNGDYAAYNPIFGLGPMVTTGTATNFANYSAALVSGANTPAAINANTAALVISANTTTGALRFGTGGTLAITFTSGNEVLNLALGGLLKSNNDNIVDIGTSALRGVLTAGGTNTTGTTDLVTYQNQNTTTINSVIADTGLGTSKVRFVKSGAGTLRVTAPNTYSGGTIVNQGTLTLLATTAGAIVIPAAGGLTINNATVTQTTNNQQIDPATHVTINGGGVLNLTTGNNTLASLTFNNPGSTVAPAMNIAATTLTLTANNAITSINDNHAIIPIISNLGSGPAAGTGTLLLTGSAPVINVGGSAAIGLTISTLLNAGANVITKSGTGTLALTSGSSIVAGGFNIDQGMVIVGTTNGSTAAVLNNPLGTGDLRIGASGEAGLAVLSNITNTGTNFSNNIFLDGNLTIGGTHANHNIRFNTSVNFGAGSRTITVNSPSVTLTMINGVISTSAAAGTDFLVKTGLGNLVIGQAPVTGWNGAGVWIKEGMLQTLSATATPVAGSGAALPSDTPLKISAGAGFDVTGFNQTIAGLADGALGSGGFITNSVASNVTLTLNSNVDSIFSGSLTDTATGTTNRLAFTKTGSGTLTLNGLSSYSGATNVNTGKLILNGTIAATVSSGTTFNVAAGATLGGTGTIGTTLGGVITNVTVAGNATIDLHGDVDSLGNPVIDNLQILAPTSTSVTNLTVSDATTKTNLWVDLGSNGSTPAVDRIDVTNRLKIFNTPDAIDATVTLNPLATQIAPTQLLFDNRGRLQLITYSSLDTTTGGGGMFGFASGLATEQYMGNNYAVEQTPTSVDLTFWKIDDPTNAYWRGGTADNITSWNSFKDQTSDTNFFTTATGNDNTLQVPGENTNVFFANTGYAAANLATTLDKSFLINSLNFSSITGFNPVSIAPGSGTDIFLTLVGKDINGNTGTRGINVASDTQSAITITADILLGGDQVWNNDGFGGLFIAGSQVTGPLKELDITGSGHTTISAALKMTGSNEFSKSGDGTLTLSGANTYTLPTNIAGGIVEITGAGTFGDGSGVVTIADAGSVVMNQSGSTTISNYIRSSAVFTSGGSFTQSGTGTTILTNDNDLFYGSVAVSRGTLVSAGSGLGSLQKASTITVGGAGNVATLVARGSLQGLGIATIQGLHIQNQGVLSPGASATGNHEVIGMLDAITAPITMAAGSTFNFQFLGGLRAYDSVNGNDDPSGTVDADDASYQLANGAGTAWDLLYASSLNLDLGLNGKIDLKVISMADLSTPGENPSGVDPLKPLDPNALPGTPQTLHWLFANTSNGVTLNGTTITGDINDYFNIDSSQVQPPADAPFTGSFYVSLVGNDLYLNYAAVPEPGSLLLMGIAGLGFGGMGWKKRRRKLAEEAAEKTTDEEAAAPAEIA